MLAPRAETAMSLESPEPAPRVCGRCRKQFEGDPNLHPGTMPDWWLCPPCRMVLLPPVPS